MDTDLAATCTLQITARASRPPRAVATRTTNPKAAPANNSSLKVSKINANHPTKRGPTSGTIKRKMVGWARARKRASILGLKELVSARSRATRGRVSFRMLTRTTW